MSRKDPKPLTEKQTFVRDCLREGDSIALIAEKMEVGEGTVYNHRRKVLDAGHSIAPLSLAPVSTENPVILEPAANGHRPHGYEVVFHELGAGIEAEEEAIAKLKEELVEAERLVKEYTDHIYRREQRVERLRASRDVLDKDLVDETLLVTAEAAA